MNYFLSSIVPRLVYILLLVRVLVFSYLLTVCVCSMLMSLCQSPRVKTTGHACFVSHIASCNH